MKTTWFAAFSLMAVACGSSSDPEEAGPGEAVPLSIETYTSPGSGYGVAVSSHLILGETEAVLVDGQLFKADADAVVAKVRASKRTLTTVFLTHAHPDHYLGFQVIQQAFPSARFLTTPAVLADFDQAAPPTFEYLKKNLGPQIADALVTPEAIDGGTLLVDGVQLDVIEMPNAGESAHAAALALRSQGSLFSGDLLYNDVHLVVGECHADGWKKNLDAVEAMGFTTFYPGHGGKIDAAVLAADATYIDGVIPILEANAPEQDAMKAESAIGAQFPAYQSSFLLDYSTKQYFTNCR